MKILTYTDSKYKYTFPPSLVNILHKETLTFTNTTISIIYHKISLLPILSSKGSGEYYEEFHKTANQRVLLNINELHERYI